MDEKIAPETQPATTGPSKKQQFAAVALSTAVSVVLTVAATAVADRIASRVDTAIRNRKQEKKGS